MKIVSSKEMAKIESKAIQSGSLDAEFMEEAGLSIARLAHAIIERNDIKSQVTLICGKGNNGADAYVAGIHLLNMGYSVDAMQLLPFKGCTQLCQVNQTRFFNAGGLVKEISNPDDLSLPLNGLIIDGLFGTGFNGKIQEPLASIIYKINHSKIPVLSVDIPSGLNGDTGMASNLAIKATETAFLGLPKIGFFINDGWNHVGKLRYVDFGLPFKSVKDAKTSFEMLEIAQAKSLMPLIIRSRNKYEAGYVVALAGSKEMPGASILSTTASLKSGAGIVKLLFNEDMREALAFAPHELIKIPFAISDHTLVLEQLNKATAVLVGPGLGTNSTTVKLLKKIMPKLKTPSVLDADALNIIASNKINIPKNSILTPHKGELERLLGLKNYYESVDLEFLSLAYDFAVKHSVTLILKGGPTFIFTKDKPIYVNITGDPGMATAGSGDVLTGLLASFLAAGLEPHDAALLGTFLHGVAGEIAAENKTSYCMIASDIIDSLPQAFKILI
jgi:NAD(P)H-hydrate epimerase